MEQHINIRYSLQNFPRHHEKYIDYFLIDYVVEKARVPSEWWNFWEKVWSGEALVYTPSNDWNRRHIQSDHYSKYAFQKASRKILNLFPDIYGRYMILFLKKVWLSLLWWETAFFSQRIFSSRKTDNGIWLDRKQVFYQTTVEWKNIILTFMICLLYKEQVPRHDLHLQNKSLCENIDSCVQFYGRIRSLHKFHNPSTPFSETLTLPFIHSISCS